MKKTTVKKYENFLAACLNESVISNIRQLAKAHSVSVTFTDWLIKNRYLVKLAGGSYKLMATLAKANNVVRLYENRNEPKQSKPEQAGFAYPISVRCENDDDREKCIRLLEHIGYKNYTNDNLAKNRFVHNIINNLWGKVGVVGDASDTSPYNISRYYIDHFNPDLIRNIASVRTGDVWVKGEPAVHHSRGYEYIVSAEGANYWPNNGLRRPTIAEICDHYGYELNGMNIVKKSEVVEPHASEIVTEMKEIQSESKSLAQREAEAIKLLKSIESDHGVSYSLTRTETTKTVLL